MKTLVADVKYIIPGHDAKMFSIFPAVSKDVIEIKIAVNILFTAYAKKEN